MSSSFIREPQVPESSKIVVLLISRQPRWEGRGKVRGHAVLTEGWLCAKDAVDCCLNLLSISQLMLKLLNY